MKKSIQEINKSEYCIEISKENVLRRIGCTPENELYQEFSEEYEEVLEVIKKEISPKTVFKYGIIENDELGIKEGTEVLYLLSTIGDCAEKNSSIYFRTGDYIKGVLADYIGDEYLFAMDKENMRIIRTYCSCIHRGILERREAPANLPMEAQKCIFDNLKDNIEQNVNIMNSYMYRPIKTLGQIYVLTEDEKIFQAQHDCSVCNNYKCKMRKSSDFEITIEGQDSQIKCKRNQTVMEAFIDNKIYHSSPCGGTGKCGKCAIKILQGEVLISSEDQKLFTEEELCSGYRLACKAVPKTDIQIRLLSNNEAEFNVLTDYAEIGNKMELSSEKENFDYFIAIDLGTTTLAAGLVSCGVGKVIATASGINHQRAYGADVISRIHAANQGALKQLQKSIQKDLQKIVMELLQGTNITSNKIKEIVMAGNTTMIHLLMGYSCESLGIYPFEPVNIKMIKGNYKDIIAGDQLDCMVTLFPGISTYVGGDIVAGLLSCGFCDNKKVNLIIDLGTNGEIALGNCDKILVTSTAAGPAFEGGNISCGTGSIPGAINKVEIKNEIALVNTIKGQAPIGLCGTGLIETISELLKEELMDDTGMLCDKYVSSGYPLALTEDGKQIILSQKDISELQLAKSAIRTGVEILLKKYEISYDEINRVYLAGGFGYNLDKEKGIHIGILPEEFRSKIEVIGNSSLSGCIKLAFSSAVEEKLNLIIRNSEEINLSSDKDFQNLYIEYMMF